MPLRSSESELENATHAVGLAEMFVEKARARYNQACRRPDASAIITSKAALDAAILKMNGARLQLKSLTENR